MITLSPMVSNEDPTPSVKPALPSNKICARSFPNQEFEIVPLLVAVNVAVPPKVPPPLVTNEDPFPALLALYPPLPSKRICARSLTIGKVSEVLEILPPMLLVATNREFPRIVTLEVPVPP